MKLMKVCRRDEDKAHKKYIKTLKHKSAVLKAKLAFFVSLAVVVLHKNIQHVQQEIHVEQMRANVGF